MHLTTAKLMVPVVFLAGSITISSLPPCVVESQVVPGLPRTFLGHENLIPLLGSLSKSTYSHRSQVQEVLRWLRISWGVPGCEDKQAHL